MHFVETYAVYKFYIHKFRNGNCYGKQSLIFQLTQVKKKVKSEKNAQVKKSAKKQKK